MNYHLPEALFGFEVPLVDLTSSWLCVHSGGASWQTPAKTERLW